MHSINSILKVSELGKAYSRNKKGRIPTNTYHTYIISSNISMLPDI